MKSKWKILPSILVCLLMAGFVSADPSLIAHWKFDEGAGTSVADSSGNGNIGTLSGSPAWTAGIQGNALDMDGSNDYMGWNTPNPGEFHNAFTERAVTAWVSIDSTQGPNIIYEEGGATNGVTLAYRSGPQKIVFATAQLGINVEIESASTFSPGSNWVHVAGIYDNGAMRLFINGVEEVTSTNGASILAHGSDPLIGKNDGSASLSGSGRYWHGKLDEVRVYDRALSAAEVQTIYLTDLNPDVTPPSVPQNPVATGTSQAEVNLSWDASTDPESGIDLYNVYRNGTLIGTSSSTSFTDGTVIAGQTYGYQISAVNGAGLESGLSSMVTATVPADVTAPFIVLAEVGFYDQTLLNITWSEEVDQTTAENPANYVVNNGVTVLSATQFSPTNVLLTTTPHGEYTVTSNGVEDLAGNAAVNEQEDYSMVGCFI